MNGKLRNIIIVYDCANINGGAAKVAIQSAIALSKEGYNVYYFSATGPIEKRLCQSEVKVKCLGLNDINHGSRLSAIKNGVWNKTVSKEFLDFLYAFSVDDTIIHIHGWVKALSSSVVKISNEKGFKTLITLHDYFTLCPNGGFYDYRKQQICNRDPMSLKCIFCNCDKRNYRQKIWRVIRQIVQDKHIRYNSELSYISISQKNEDLVRPFVRGKDFYRIDNPVQLAKYQIEDCSQSNVFLYVGRVSEEKGIDLFCKAITNIKETHDIEGIVIGDGVLYTELKEKYPHIVFEGWKSPADVQCFIQRARALILPSRWYEGAPLNIIEAMSAALPCIVSDCTSATEIVVDNLTGLVFQANDVRSLEKKILKSLDDELIHALQKNIKEYFDLTKYSEDTHVRAIINVYKTILQ